MAKKDASGFGDDIVSRVKVTQPSSLNTQLPRTTASLCPECIRIIKAEIYEEDGQIKMRKTCPEHGEYTDIYFSDAEIFKRFQETATDGIGVENPQVDMTTGCPYDCGLCDKHLSHSGIVNIDLTNRCNLRCPICFANANDAGFVYEPDVEDVKGMLRMLRNMRPVPVNAVQFAGGEPTIYPHFLEVVRYANKEMNIQQVQVATNGIEMAKKPELAQQMLDAGLHTVYLQFDGFKPETYKSARGKENILELKKKVIERCSQTKPRPLSVSLVPTIVRGVNDDEIGDMINFAMENSHTVRSIVFQPVSFCGRIEEQERLKGRYTIADLIHDSVEQTGYLTTDDWYPVPIVSVLSDLMGLMTGMAKLSFTCHPGCGAATYVFRGDDGKLQGAGSFIDAYGIYEEAKDFVEKLKEEKAGSVLQKTRAYAFGYKVLRRYIDMSKAPKGFKALDLIFKIMKDGNKKALSEFHWRTLFLGAMHFMDRYNYDIERVKRCLVHYATPDGRIIPFCAYNTGPTFRQEVESKFAMTFEEYRQRNKGWSLENDLDTD